MLNSVSRSDFYALYLTFDFGEDWLKNDGKNITFWYYTEV